MKDSKLWPLEFAKAVPINKNLSMVVPKFFIWMLADIKKYASVKNGKLIQKVINLYLRVVNGDYLEEYEWKAVEGSFCFSRLNSYSNGSASASAFSMDASRAALRCYDSSYNSDEVASYAAYAAEAAATRYAGDAAAAVAAARKQQAKKLIEILSNT